MQLQSFRCRNLNSFLNYDLHFFPKVTFLHGINGSGKTTILRAVAALLTPDPYWVIVTKYDLVEVTIEHHDQIFTISAEKGTSPNAVTIKVSNAIEIEDTLEGDDLRVLSRMADEDAYRFPGLDPDDYALRTSVVADNVKTFSFLNSLPTPIFLGLDRTTLTPSVPKAGPRSQARSRSVHPYFRTQLDEAISEAERLLTRQLSVLSNERNRIFEELRNQFVLSLFRLPDTDQQGSTFSPESIDTSGRFRDSVVPALRKINVSETEISDIVEPFFREVIQVSDAARAALAKFQAVADQHEPSAFNDYFEILSPYVALRPFISIIEGTLTKIEAANTRDSIISRPLETYQEIMRRFFGDSRKELVFEENTVKVKLPSGDHADLNSLSSGERQIFVLITHLVFNPSMRGENVLLIDEPELSLHLKWQRQFVSAIREASPSTQMILATHSPEIIFDMEANLIPLEN